MAYRSEAQRAIPAPSKLLWETISKMNGMEDWYPELISESKVQQNDSGYKRHCVMTNGGELDERILVSDDRTMTFVYAIDRHPLPARNVVGTIRIDDRGDDSVVNWSAQFDADALSAKETIAMINQMYADGLSSLDAFHQNPKS